MNKLRLSLLVILAGVLLFGCFLQGPFSNSPSGVEPSLPPDQINDVARSYSDPFEFDTLLPVNVDLTVALYESDPTSKSASLTNLTTDTADIVVTIHDSKGNLVFKGKVQADGTLTTQLQIPAAPDDMTLTLQAEGFEDRKVIIRDMRSAAEINRVMGMLRQTVAAKSVGESDTDGDGVPDEFDDFPTDPLRAFVNRVPAEQEEVLTIAFEDLYLHAQAGDADYNDFIGQYFVEEILNAGNKIVEIRGEAKAAVKIAGYNHRFGIFVDTFKGLGTLDVKYYDENDNLLAASFSEEVEDYADIVLFNSTKDMVGRSSSFHLKFETPQLEVMMDRPPYNPYIYVYNTHYDIHMVGEQPLPWTENPLGSEFIDSEGFPWALLVPVDWVEKEMYPAETQRIEIPYPRFTLWRESGGTEHTDWYLHYYDPYEEPTTYDRIVIDTHSPNGSFTADTYIDLFDSAGDPDADDPWTGDDTTGAIAWATDGNPDFPNMARIDYTGGLSPGTYYIRVRGAFDWVDDYYAIRVLSLKPGETIPAYDFLQPLAGRPDAFEAAPGDDDPKSGGVPNNPVPISLGETISRSIDYDYTVNEGDIDWFVFVLP